MASPSFKPFADDSASVTVAGLTVENGTDGIAIYGQGDITRDKEGLRNARALKALVDGIVQTLEAEKNLPDRVAPPDKPETVKNPFT